MFCWITRQIMCVVHQNCGEKYHAQLEYYEQALSMMTGKKVKEKLIYSFTLGEVIEV